MFCDNAYLLRNSAIEAANCPWARLQAAVPTLFSILADSSLPYATVWCPLGLKLNACIQCCMGYQITNAWHEHNARLAHCVQDASLANCKTHTNLAAALPRQARRLRH